MHRFLAPFDPNAKTIRIADADELHHLKNALRLKEGETVVLFNGKGREAKGLIHRLTANYAEITISEVKNVNEAHQGPYLVLACAIPKKAKFELIIEKATELGVAEIIPLVTARTEVHFSSVQASKKLIRYQAVATNASKQSGRTTVPQIRAPMPFAEALGLISRQDHAAFVGALRPKAEALKTVLTAGLRAKQKIFFFVGPEGDFTPEELALACERDCVPVSLGPTVLKVDTAAITMIAFANLILLT